MATPDFIVSLREKVGTELLWLIGVTAVVLRPAPSDAATEVLLVRRSDNGAWTPVTGIVDPGEEPADAGVRESLEEADVVVEPEQLVRVRAGSPMKYPNGDQAQYLDLVFRMSWVSGEPYPADGENSEAAWFRIDALPEMSEEMRERISAALSGAPPASFRAADQWLPHDTA